MTPDDADVNQNCGPGRSLDLLWLFLLALALRETYLLAALAKLDLATIAMVAPDSTVYVKLGDYFLTGNTEAIRHLLVAGPGYPAVLTVLAWVFGTGPWPPVMLNVLLAAASPLAVYLLAETLFGRRSVAVIAGLYTALSFTGISLSTSILTDQPYYTLQAFALLVFLAGLKGGRSRWWFLSAGLLAGTATLIRSMGQLWPYLFLAMAAFHLLYLARPRNWRLLARSLWTPAIMLVLILSWSAFNHSRSGMFTFTTNGVRATWAYIAAAAVAEHTPGGSIDSVRAAWSAEVLSPTDGQPPTEAVVQERMKAGIFAVLKQHPMWFLGSFLDKVWINIREPNYYADAQVPHGAKLWGFLKWFSHDWINPILFALSLISLWVLAVQKRWESLFVLGMTYAFFTLLTGFSFWQGSRLHYPAEMAWAILVAYLLVESWRLVATHLPGRARPMASAA
jgi:4-amino-4-deoxy-L-arabinose transferase-like glycosyltransferase